MNSLTLREKEELDIAGERQEPCSLFLLHSVKSINNPAPDIVSLELIWGLEHIVDRDKNQDSGFICYEPKILKWADRE